MVEAAAAGLPAPPRAPRDPDSDRELEHNLHLLVAVVSVTTAVNDFLFMLMRILRQRSPGLVALGHDAAAAFFTAAATSSARLAGVDHERSVEAFRGARALLEEQLAEVLEEQRAVITRVSMALHTHPRDARTNDLPRLVAADHMMAMLALGEVLMRGPGRASPPS